MVTLRNGVARRTTALTTCCRCLTLLESPCQAVELGSDLEDIAKVMSKRDKKHVGDYLKSLQDQVRGERRPGCGVQVQVQ